MWVPLESFAQSKLDSDFSLPDWPSSGCSRAQLFEGDIAIVSPTLDDEEKRSLQDKLNEVRRLEGSILDHQEVLSSRPSHRVRIAESERCVRVYAGGYTLDVGCAEGYFCGIAKQAGAARVVGIDISPHKIERARLRHPDCEFLTGDVLQPGVAEAPADVVLCFEVLQHLASYVQGILQLSHMVKPGGMLILSVPNLSPDLGHRQTEIDQGLSVEQLLRLVGGGGLGTRNGVWYFHAPLLFSEIEALGFSSICTAPIDTFDGQRKAVWWVGCFRKS
jgi:2-polyprenyl-3-methyl-5-hydroxy-6-metoxy-1,4-benzoquinol methylase